MEYKAAIMKKFKRYRSGVYFFKGEPVYISKVGEAFFASKIPDVTITYPIKDGDFLLCEAEGRYNLRTAITTKNTVSFVKGVPILVEDLGFGRHLAFKPTDLYRGWSVSSTEFKYTEKIPVSKVDATKVIIREPNERSVEKTGPSVEVTKIADLEALAFSKRLIVRLHEENLYTYKDTVLAEHLYNIDTITEKIKEEPLWLPTEERTEVATIEQLLIVVDASYFRFIA